MTIEFSQLFSQFLTTVKKDCNAEVVGKIKQEIRLVEPAKYTAMTNQGHGNDLQRGGAWSLRLGIRLGRSKIVKYAIL